MKTTPQPPHTRARAWLLAAAGCLVLPACNIDKHTVIASTGTNLGIDLTADPSTQTPRIKVGFNRAELALVPSNRSANKDPGSRLASLLCEHCAKGEPGCTNQAKCEKVLCQLTPEVLKNIKDGGAVDTAEVLMEIRMQGGILFNGIHDAGLYQRLAVGKTAVQQPGAALMFARDKKGELSADAATAVEKATAAVKAVPQEPTDTQSQRADLARAFMAASDKAPFDASAKEAGYTAVSPTPFQQFLLDEDFKSDNEGKRAAATARLKVLTESLKKRGIAVK